MFCMNLLLLRKLSYFDYHALQVKYPVFRCQETASSRALVFGLTELKRQYIIFCHSLSFFVIFIFLDAYMYMFLGTSVRRCVGPSLETLS